MGGLGENASDSVNVNVNYLSYLMSHSFQINSVFHDSDIYFGANNNIKIMFLIYIPVLAF